MWKLKKQRKREKPAAAACMRGRWWATWRCLDVCDVEVLAGSLGARKLARAADFSFGFPALTPDQWGSIRIHIIIMKFEKSSELFSYYSPTNCLAAQTLYECPHLAKH